MADAFPVSGNIDPQSFPHLLVDLHRHGATGSLKVTGPLHPKALYFRGGRVLFGSSNDPRDQLGAILIDSGRITRDQLDEVNAKVGPGNPLAKVLAESGFVNQRELGEAARMKVESILADVLSWTSGTFEFEDGVLPKGAVDLKLSTEKLLLAAVKRISDRAFALRHVELAAVLEPVPDAESALSEVRADVWPLFERLDGRRTLKDAIALTRLDEFEAVKTACAMLFLGIVKRTAATASSELDLAEQAQSGFEDPEAMYTVPLKAVAVADLPASTGFAFADSTPGYPVPEPEPDAPEAPGEAPEPGYRRSEPFPEVEPEPDEPEPPVFSAGGPIPESAPVFTMADYLKRAEAQAEPTLAFEPKLDKDSPETVYAPAASPLVSTPPSSSPPEPPERPYNPFASPPAPEPPPQTAYAPYVPPAAAAEERYEPPAVLPEPAPRISSQAAHPRPSQENLAALDALLNPASAGTRAGGERARVEKFEPQFRPPTSPARKAPARQAVARRSSGPLLAVGFLGVALATLAAWYFLLRSPEPSLTPRPTTPTTLAASVPTTTFPPATLAASPEPLPTPAASATPFVATLPIPATPAPTATPAAAASPTPTPTARPLPTTAPTPVATPRPAPTPPPATAGGASGDGRALLRQGAFSEAARSFAASLAPGARGRFSYQLLTACAPDTIAKAVQAVTADELFILPVTFQGKSCYRLCWGVYDTRPAADAARVSVPDYFRQGTSPRLSPLHELLP